MTYCTRHPEGCQTYPQPSTHGLPIIVSAATSTVTPKSVR